MEGYFQILKDDFDFKFLVSNTKLRRLGYLKILLSMFTDYEEYAVSSFNKKFETFAIEYEPYLLKHKNTKGIIKATKTGISSYPYVELALNLGLIIKNSFSYQLGKNGKVYKILTNELNIQDDNPFNLSFFDTIFFLELLLKEDYWFLYNILEQSYSTKFNRYVDLKKNFKQVLLQSVVGIKYSNTWDDINNSKFRAIEERINQWSEKDSYMEHILMPRLNWLYDMDFLDLKKDLSFSLTNTGYLLISTMHNWNNMARHNLISAEVYVNSFFLKIINDIYDLHKKIFNFAIDYEILEMYINKSFDLFKTLAPNRTTFSLAANYAKIMLFFKHSIVADENDICYYFESKYNTKYIFKYQEQYKDGFIQKITNNG